MTKKISQLPLQSSPPGTAEVEINNAGVSERSPISSLSALTPWVSDIDADGFDLNDLSNILFRATTGAPATTISSIHSTDGVNIVIGAGAGGTPITFKVAGSNQMTIDPSQLTLNGQNISSMDKFVGSIGGVLEVVDDDFAIVQTNATGVFEIEANHTTPAAAQVIGQMDFFDDSSTGTRRRYAQIHSNIEDPTNTAEDGSLFLNVIEGGALTNYISLNNALGLDITMHKNVDLIGNNLILGAGIIQFNSTDQDIHTNGSDTVFDVVTGGDFIFRVNNITQFGFDTATGADFKGNDLVNVGFMNFGSGSANLGTIRLKNGDSIEWESNPAGTNANINYSSTEVLGHNIGTGGSYNYQIAAGNEYNFNATRADFNNNDLLMGTGDVIFFTGTFVRSNGAGTMEYNALSGQAHELKVNGSNEVIISGTQVRILNNDLLLEGGADLSIEDAGNIVLFGTTGTKIGTATTQKLGFWNVTPVVQPSGTGETVGFVAGAGTSVLDDSTFTGNVGSTAYRVSDIVKALKNIGVLLQ